MFTARKSTASMLLASSLLFYPALQSLANVPQHTVQQQAGGYRVQVGKILVTSFTDGSVAQDLHNLLRRTTTQNTDALLAKCHPTRTWRLCMGAHHLYQSSRLWHKVNG